MKIVKYPHPCLRHLSKPLVRVDSELRRLAAEMLELMYEFDGVGLAANQVDLPYRLFAVNFEGDQAIKEQEFVFLNPVITNRSGMDEAEEGCLSFPGIYAPVRRPNKVTLTAFDLSGNEIHLELEGLPARAVQHETDHLDGVVFVDRLSPTNEMAVREPLESLARQFAGEQQRGLIASNEQIATRLGELEKLRT
ncbi:MAG: peptide deformylase [Pirellulales bacterium]|nr:peptide deformylase [Pirellulales bacterium]